MSTDWSFCCQSKLQSEERVTAFSEVDSIESENILRAESFDSSTKGLSSSGRVKRDWVQGKVWRKDKVIWQCSEWEKEENNWVDKAVRSREQKDGQIV